MNPSASDLNSLRKTEVGRVPPGTKVETALVDAAGGIVAAKRIGVVSVREHVLLCLVIIGRGLPCGLPELVTGGGETVREQALPVATSQLRVVTPALGVGVA